MERAGDRRGARWFGIRPLRIGGGAGGAGPRTVPGPVPAHRRGGGCDRPLRTRFRSRATASGLADGRTVGALGPVGQRHVGSDLVVTGESPAVLGAPDADVLVIAAGEDVVIVDARAEGVTITALDSLDTTRSVGSVALRGVTVERTVCFAAPRARRGRCSGSWRRPRRSASAGPALDMAVEYAKVREQFGRTIGTFQAVKHHAANMLVNAEETTAATWDAARADDLDSAWFPAAVAAVARHSHADLQRAVQHSAARWHRRTPGSTTPTCTCAGPARWPR